MVKQINMKVVILAGGFGTRLSEMTDMIPKPMVPIGGKPILSHIMDIYSSYGYNEFILALGYKASVVKEYFLDFHYVNSDFTVDLSNGQITLHDKVKNNIKVTLVDTGLNTMTGGRLRRLKSHIGSERFMMTYGDGLCDVNIDQLVNFHINNQKMVTVTTVHPGARFGEMVIENGNVKSFKEKPQTGLGWINGGFFVMEPEFLDLIQSDETVLEKEPLETVSNKNQLAAFQHDGFWQCMDTIRDRNILEDLWNSNKAPWKK